MIFYRTIYSFNSKVIDINAGYSVDVQEHIIKGYKEKAPDMSVLVKYKTKSARLLLNIPFGVTILADYIISFDMYSMKGNIIKDKDGILPGILGRWDANIERLNRL